MSMWFSITLVLCAIQFVSGLHVAVVSIPAYGHFMPVKGVAEQLLLRGHKVSLFVETAEWCDSELSDPTHKYDCVMLTRSNTFGRDLFVNMSAMEEIGETFDSIFQEMWRHHRFQLPVLLKAFEMVHAKQPVDLILMDLSTIAGFSLSAKFNIPHVSMFPLTMHMTVGPATYLPSLGTAFSRNLTTVERFVNHIIKFAVSAASISMLRELNDARKAYGIPPFASATELAGLDGLIFAPTIWGYDIPQPLCPNIVAIGAFSPSVAHTPMETDLQEYLDNCPQGAVYVNFGTLAVVGDAMHERVKAAMIAAAPLCVVWKIAEDDRRATTLADAKSAGRDFYVVKRFNNPIEIMRHPQTKVFVTHCGDTSVLEAIQAELPLAGIPFFADQADVCQRLDESGIGQYVGHKHRFTVEDLRSAVTTLANSSTSSAFRERIRKVHRVSNMLGGAERAATMIEDRMAHGLLRVPFLEQCVFLANNVNDRISVVEIQQYDILGVQMLFAVVVFVLLLKKLCCRSSRNVCRGSELSAGRSSPPKVRVRRSSE